MQWHGPLRDGVARVVTNAIDECAFTQARFGDFASMHEAYGVLTEEVAELFEAVRMKQGHLVPGDVKYPKGKTRADCIREEAIQVAAVALRIAEQAGRVTR